MASSFSLDREEREPLLKGKKTLLSNMNILGQLPILRQRPKTQNSSEYKVSKVGRLVLATIPYLQYERKKKKKKEKKILEKLR